MARFGFLKYLSGYRAGDWVEVKSADEILATLDEKGRLERLPFMPEMLQFCGKRFQVFKSAHKSCDTINDWKTIRHTPNAVHLEGLRCDGDAHGGCQAGCLLFWKTEWLIPITKSSKSSRSSRAHNQLQLKSEVPRCSLDRLRTVTRVAPFKSGQSEERYSCQATELREATTPLNWRDPRLYLMDLMSRNVRMRDFVRYSVIGLFNMVMRLHWRGRPYPYIWGLAQGKTPSEKLDLQAGERVQVRSKKEIMQTINEGQRNRGLWFDVEMVPFCGKSFRVLRKVERIINEKNGSMIKMPNDCVILENVACGGCLSRYRLFCSRSIYPFWREIWLRRVE